MTTNIDQEIRVLITGSSGFIGSALMTHLLQKGIIVRGIDINEPRYPEHQIHWEQVDILDKKKLLNTATSFSPTHVVHLAARTDLGLKDTIDGFSVNIDGVRNVVEVCKMLHDLYVAIFASTIIVCKVGYLPKADDDYHPTTPYGESKVIGEKIIRESANGVKFTWCIVRPTSIWGPGYGSHYLDFFRKIAKGQYFHPGKANNLVVYGYIGNCVYQIEKIMMAKSEQIHKKVFYLGDYWPTRLRDWAEMIQKEMGKSKIRVLPDNLVRLTSACGDLLYSMGWTNVPLTSFRLKNMTTDRLYDTSATHAIVGELPYTQKKAVRETIEWLKENGQI